MFSQQHRPIIDSFLLFDDQRLPPILKLVGVLNLPHKNVDYKGRLIEGQAYC